MTRHRVGGAAPLFAASLEGWRAGPHAPELHFAAP